MSGVLATPDPPPPRRDGRRLAVDVVAFVALALGLGAVVGVLWWRVVDLPGYLVNTDGGASTSERGLADFIAGDAWFTLLGAVASLLLGWLAWVRLGSRGWPVVLLAAGGAVAASLICWTVGYHLGPGDFTRRLAAAKPGDVVQIELTIRAKASLLVWPFAATIPVLLASSLGRDDEEPRPLLSGPWLSRLSRGRLGRDLRDRSVPPGPT